MRKSLATVVSMPVLFSLLGSSAWAFRGEFETMKRDYSARVIQRNFKDYQVRKAYQEEKLNQTHSVSSVASSHLVGVQTQAGGHTSSEEASTIEQLKSTPRIDLEVFRKAVQFARDELRFGVDASQAFGHEMAEMGEAHFAAFLDVYSLVKEDAQESLQIRSSWKGSSQYPLSHQHHDYLSYGSTTGKGPNRELYQFSIDSGRLVKATQRVLRLTKSWDRLGPESAQKSAEGAAIFKNIYTFLKAKGYLDTLKSNYKGVALPEYREDTPPSCLYSTVMGFAYRSHADSKDLIPIAESFMHGVGSGGDPIEALSHAFSALNPPKPKVKSAIVSDSNGEVYWAQMEMPRYDAENDYGHLATPILNHSEVQNRFKSYSHSPWD